MADKEKYLVFMTNNEGKTALIKADEQMIADLLRQMDTLRDSGLDPAQVGLIMRASEDGDNIILKDLFVDRRDFRRVRIKMGQGRL